MPQVSVLSNTRKELRGMKQLPVAPEFKTVKYQC